MCPSTSCGTRAGSQFGIWLAIAVIRPNVNEAVPSSPRMKRRARRRSLRILRRRPFPVPRLLRLPRSKPGILALNSVFDPYEGVRRGSVDAAGLFHGDQHGRAFWHELVQAHQYDGAATFERSGGLGLRPTGDPRLVG